MSKLSELTGLTTPALTDLFYVVQNLQEYKATGSQLLELLKTNIVVPITQDDYDDLTPAEKSNGCIYLITDSSLIDDTTTSLSSTWSSDKISGEIGAVTDDLILIRGEYQGSTATIGANGWGDSMITIPFVQGYRAISFYKIYLNSPSNLCINSFDIEQQASNYIGRVRIRNLSNGNFDASARADILYIKNH